MSANKNFQPVKSCRAFQVIAEQIKESIFAGDLKPGEKLPTERDMAKVFNVSRVTLRSALLKLEQSGLLDIRPGAGGGFFIDVIRDRNGEEAQRLMFEHVNDMGKLFNSESKSR